MAWEWLEQARLIVESENAPESWTRYLVETEAEVELWAGRPVAAYDLVVDGLDLVRRHRRGGVCRHARRARAAGARRRGRRHRDRESRKRLGRHAASRSTTPATWPAANQPEDAPVHAWARPRAPGSTSRATRRPGAAPPPRGTSSAGRSPRRTRAGARRRLGSTPEWTRRSIDALRDAHARRVGLGAARLVEESSASAGGTASTSSRNRSRPSRTPWTSTG